MGPGVATAQPVPSISVANELDRNEWKIHQPGPKRDDGFDDEAAGLARIDHVTLTEGFSGTHCILAIGIAASLHAMDAFY